MVSDGEKRHHLFFQHGSIIPLSQGKNHLPRVADALCQSHLISKEDLEKARIAQNESGKTMYEILIELGLISEEDFVFFFKEKMKEDLYDLFLRKDAFFEFRKEDVPRDYADLFGMMSHYTFNSGQILMEAARRTDEWSRIRARVPSMKYIFIPSREEPPVLEGKGDNPVPLEKIVPLLRPLYTVADIVREAASTSFDVCKTLYLLLLQRQIRSLPPENIEVHFKEALKEGDFRLAVKYLEYAQELGFGARDIHDRMQVALLSDPRFMQDTENIRLAGKLENVNFPAFFLLLFLKKHTGMIRVSDSDSAKILYISPSEIAILSKGSREQAQLGQILVQEGKITCRQLDKALTLGKKTGELLGQTLLTMGAITQEGLLYAVRKKILNEVFDIFLWRNAHFEFVKNRRPDEFDREDARVASLSLVSREQLKDIVTNLTHFGEISKEISTWTIFQKESKKAKKDGKGVFSNWLSSMDDPAETETGILRLVDGRKTVRDIVRLSRDSAISVAEQLYESMNRQAIRPLTMEEVKTGASEALEAGRLDECLRLSEFGLERGSDPAFFQKKIDEIQTRAPDVADSTREYKLEGDFLTFSLAELFQSLYINKHSGTLVVSDGLNEKLIYFSKGVIYLLTRGSRSVSRLGDILIDSEKVTESDVERALRIQKQSHKLIGEILVEEGIVTEEDIHEAIKEKIKEELFDIFLWEGARFTFTKNYFPDEFNQAKGVTKISLDPGRILMKAVSRIEEWNRIHAALQTTKAIFYQVEGADLDAGALDRKERAVLNLIDGARSVDDIIEQTNVGKFQTCGILENFLKSGVVKSMDLERLNEEAENAFQAKNFELCVTFYEAAMQYDSENEFLRQYLEMIKGNIAQNPHRMKIVMKGFDLASLFRTLLRDRTSGTLTAKDSRSRRFFYIAPDEFLILSEGDRKGDTLEQALIDSGQLTDQKLKRALEYAKKMGTSLGEILEKQGVLSRKEVEAQASEVGGTLLFDLFHWTEVNISFEAHTFPSILEDPEKDVFDIKVPSWPIVEKVLQKHDKMEVFKKSIPSSDLVFRLRDKADLEITGLAKMGRNLVSLTDGRRTFGDILALSNLGSFHAYEAAADLVTRGILIPLTSEEALKEAENAKVFHEYEQAIVFYRTALVQAPQRADVREKIDALKRNILSGTTHHPESDMVAGVQLSDILKNLARTGKEGTLQAKTRDAERMIHFAPGRVRAVSTGAHQGTKIGELLVECRMASEEHVAKALAFQKKSSKLLGQILLLQGVITEKDLDEVLREKIIGDLSDLFRWEDASFSFQEGPPPPIFEEGEIPLSDFSTDPKTLIDMSLDRQKSLKNVEEHLSSPAVIFRVTDSGQGESSAQDRNRVLSFIDGKRNLDQIMAKLKGARYYLKMDFLKLIRNQVIEPLPLDLAKKKGHEMYMFNDFENCATLYRWALELVPENDRIRRNLERAQKYLGGGESPD
jgi:hypothetical protein